MQLFGIDLRISELLPRFIERRLVTRRLGRNYRCLHRAGPVERLLQVGHECTAITIGSKSIDGIAISQGTLEIRPFDFRIRHKGVQLIAIDPRKGLDLFVGQRHDYFDSIATEWCHRDVHDALRIDTLGQDANSLVDQCATVDAIRHANRIHQTDTAAEIAAESNLVFRWIDRPDAATCNDENNDDFPECVLHEFVVLL